MAEALCTPCYNGKDFVDFRPSSSCPVVLTVPHGGSLAPPNIPDRTSGCIEPDDESWSLAEAVMAAWKESPFGAPTMVGLALHRLKLDGNKNLCLACEQYQGYQDEASGAAAGWTSYHQLIEKSLEKCVEKFGFALLLDLHGQSHRPGVTELGYLLDSQHFFLTDDELSSAPPTQTSMDSLVRRLSETHKESTLAMLVRGPDSFGGFLEEHGFPCTPSPTRQEPVSEEALAAALEANHDIQATYGPPPEVARAATYFSGAYTTKRYAASATLSPDEDPLSQSAQEGWASKVVAVQLETSWQGVRDTPDNQASFGKALAKSAGQFLEKWYGWTPE